MTMEHEGQSPGVHRQVRPVGTASNVLKLKGLPYSTTKEQSFDFFKEYALLDVGFVYEPDGRASGLVSSYLYSFWLISFIVILRMV